MSPARIRIILGGSAAGAVRAMEETEVAAKRTTDVVTARFEMMGKRLGHVFSLIGLEAERMGIGGAGAVSALGQHMETTDKKAKSLGAGMVSLGNRMMLGVAGAGAFIAYESVKVAMSVATSQVRLQASLQAAHISWSKNTNAIEAYRTKMMNLGFSQESTDAAIAQGVLSTGNLHKSLGALGLAANLARFKNIDLASAMLTVQKAMQGQLRPLKQLGIDLAVPTAGAYKLYTAHLALNKAIHHAITLQMQYGDQIKVGGKHYWTYQSALTAVAAAHTKLNMVQGASGQIMTALNQKLRDQAQLYAQTLPGKIDIFRQHVSTLEMHIGNALIPKLASIAGFADKAFKTVRSNPALLAAGAAVIGVPIIAALGSFANRAIVHPLMQLGRVFTSGHPLQALSNLFSGKNGPAVALDQAAVSLKGSATALTDAAAKLGAGGVRGGGGLPPVITNPKPTEEGAWASKGKFLSELLGTTTLAGIGAVIAHQMAAPYESAPYQRMKHFTWSSLGRHAAWSADPINIAGETFAGIGRDIGYIGRLGGLIGSLFSGGSKNSHAVGTGFTSPFWQPQQQAAQMRASMRPEAVAMEQAIAKALKGGSKTPQVVKLLNEAGLGKIIGTGAGSEVAKAIILASKDQTKNWNLPYVIAQGFQKVNATTTSAFNAHVAGSASKQDAASRDLSGSAKSLSSSASAMNNAAQAMQIAAQAMQSAVTHFPTHVTVTPPPRTRP